MKKSDLPKYPHILIRIIILVVLWVIIIPNIIWGLMKDFWLWLCNLDFYYTEGFIGDNIEAQKMMFSKKKWDDYQWSRHPESKFLRRQEEDTEE